MSGVLATTQRLLGEIFPRDNYKKAGKSMSLHYLVALNQPTETIINWISSNPGFLNYNEEAHLKLTPLSVCVLKGNRELASIFLDRGADVSISDHQDWTPLHHATVIGDDNMVELLKTRAAAKAKLLQNAMKGTCLDLKNLISVRPAKDDEEVFYLREVDQVRKCTALRFREITRSYYCSTVVVSPDKLIESWKNKKSNVLPILTPQALLEEEHSKCVNNPPKISLGKIAKGAVQGYDVFAEENIPAFRGITVYGGTFENNPTEVDYLLDNISGKEVRNLGSMINDGFPNCICQPVVIRGFCYYLILSMRAIKKGEALFWNYGISHKVKLGAVHLELNDQELLQYAQHIPDDFRMIQTTSLNDVHIGDRWKQYLVVRERLKYLLETPATLFYLISKRCFNLQGFAFFDEHSESIYEKLQLPKEKFHVLSTFVRMCCTLELLSSQAAPIEIRDEIRNLLLKWCSSFPMSLIINCLAFFINTLVKDIKSQDDWIEFKKDLDDYVFFMEALHYYCSTDNSFNYLEFLPKIKDHFLKLSARKRKEGLVNLKQHIQGIDGARKEQLETLLKELDK